MVPEEEEKRDAAGVAHPSFCDPGECLLGNPGVAFQRHRSAPLSMTLRDDILGTRFVSRVTEALVEPGVRYLEVDVYTADQEEPVSELRFSSHDMFSIIDFFFGFMQIGQPMEVEAAEFVVREMA